MKSGAPARTFKKEENYKVQSVQMQRRSIVSHLHLFHSIIKSNSIALQAVYMYQCRTQRKSREWKACLGTLVNQPINKQLVIYIAREKPNAIYYYRRFL